MTESVIPILALARTGAATRAWDAFVAAGLEAASDNPAVMTLEGRLLKDQARKATGETQSRLYLQSAKAYAAAASLRPDSYPLINAATMSLFAGQKEQVQVLAKQVLTLLESTAGIGETPYWHEATKAEAYLLLGQRAAAEAALVSGVKHAPQAWEDHATTLRQFRAILQHRGEPQDWLSLYAPPKSIYFTGIMGIAADDRVAAIAIDAQLAESGARFAYGALAAGADILLAEAMLREGGELHVVLPVMPAAFKARSVAPYGNEWARRFDALFEQAASIEIVDNGDQLSFAAIDLAAKVAKGRAIDNAKRLQSEAVRFEIGDALVALPPGDSAFLVEVERSAAVDEHSELEARQTALWIATDASDRPSGVMWQQYGSAYLGRVASPEQMAPLLLQLHEKDPEAAIAVHVGVADDNVPNDKDIARLDRLLQAATAGTTIATAATAMLIQASFPKAWTEPLGELPDPVGAISVYAVGRFNGAILLG